MRLVLQYHGTCFGGENWYFQRGEVRTCLPCHVHLSKFGGTTDEPSSSEGAFDVLPTDMYVKCRGLLWQRAQAVRKHSSVPVPVQHSYYGGTNKNSRSQNHIVLLCSHTQKQNARVVAFHIPYRHQHNTAILHNLS